MNHMTGFIRFTAFLLCGWLFAVPATAQNMSFSARDWHGRTIVLDREPERIACLYAFAGHVVAMLDRGPDMVAIVNGLKKDVLLNRMIPGIKNKPVPAKGGIIHIEALLKTRPDIVFLKPETAAVQAEIDKLERFHLPFFVAGCRSMAQQMAIIENMGKIINRYHKALAYTRYYRRIIDMVQKRTEMIPDSRRSRLFHSVNEATRTVAPNTLEADWTAAAGVINVSVGNSLHGRGEKHFADIEQIILWNPDVIIVNEKKIARQILTDKKWSPIKAVREKKVFPIPLGISRWGHPGGLETPMAILWTAKTVYPELMDDIDLEKEITHFYSTFFNMTLDHDMVQRILSNKKMRN